MTKGGGLGGDADFGRGNGDPLGGPDAANLADPMPYEVARVRISFMADRGGDAWGAREVVLAFDSLTPGTPEHEALMWLWQKAAADALARARAEGIRLEIG